MQACNGFVSSGKRARMSDSSSSSSSSIRDELRYVVDGFGGAFCSGGNTPCCSFELSKGSWGICTGGIPLTGIKAYNNKKYISLG